jgi:hypothetical protein
MKPVRKHTWTAEDRVSLAIITKLYTLSKTVQAHLFSAVIQRRLDEEGLYEGLSSAAVHAQVKDLRESSRGLQFRQIQAMGTNETRRQFRTFVAKIEAAARALGINLQHALAKSTNATLASLENSAGRTLPHTGLSGRMPTQRRGAVEKVEVQSTQDPIVRDSSVTTAVTGTSLSSLTTDSDSLCSYEPDSDEEDIYFRPPGPESFSATSLRIPPQLTINFDAKGRPARPRPRLLFRAFEPAHGLRARRFLTVSSIASPPAYESQEARMMFYRHLSEEKSFQSPLISLTQSPRRALSLIQKATEPRYFAVLDYLDVEQQIRQTFENNAGPWLVPSVCKDFGFDALRKVSESGPTADIQDFKGYVGFGEVSLDLSPLLRPNAELTYAVYRLWCYRVRPCRHPGYTRST